PERPRRRGISQLELDLAESTLYSQALDDRNIIVDHCRQHRALAVLQLHPAAQRRQAGHGDERRSPDVRDHQGDRRLWRTATAPGKLELSSGERRPLAGGWELQRPALALAEPKVATPASQAQVRR